MTTNREDLFDVQQNLDPEIFDLITFLQENERKSTGFVTKQRILKNIDGWGRVINQWLCYPDLFIDAITPKNSEFELYPFQRIILRVMSRMNQSYLVFSRGTSKSFLAFTERFIHADLIPNHHTGIIAGTKKQAASIAKEKIIGDIWKKFPLLANEMQKRKVGGKYMAAYLSGMDYAQFNFKSGSWLDVASDRGLRRESAIFEEIIEQDPTFVTEVAIPWLNKPRTNLCGFVNPNEPHSQKIFVTSAGYQGTWAYEKLIDTLARSVIWPDKYMVLCGDYHLPLYHGLITQQTVDETLNSPSYSKSSFEREFSSIWSDSPVGAVFGAATISKLRKVKRVEFKNKINTDNKECEDFYAVCADMAKDGEAATAYVVAKVSPQKYFFTYKIVNLGIIDNSDYLFVANRLKELVLDFEAKLLIYDANGIGSALRDWINKETINTDGVPLAGLGIINPPTDSEKDIIKYPDNATIVYEIKSSGQKGNEIHHFFFSRMSNGSIVFPIKLTEALDLYAKNESFLKLSERRKEALLTPYKMMDLAELQFRNLDIADTSDTLNKTMKIVRRNGKIQKDFFSASEYLVYAVGQQLELPYYKGKRKKANNRMDAFMIS